MAGVAQGAILASAMLLNHHPAGYPQIALWNELLNMMDISDLPLVYFIHFVEPELPLLEALNKDDNFLSEVELRKQEFGREKKLPVLKHPLALSAGTGIKA